MATSTLQCNENNDLYLPDGRNLVVLSGESAVEQDVRTATLMRKGEDIFNVNAGVDYFGTIFTPQQDYDAARQSIVNQILSSPDVTGVSSITIGVSYQANPNSGLNETVFTFAAQITTIYGISSISGSVTK